MWKLTVDTNAVRDYAEPQRPGHEVAKKLVELHGSGRCEIRVTTRLDADVPGGPLREKLESLSALVCRQLELSFDWTHPALAQAR